MLPSSKDLLAPNDNNTTVILLKGENRGKLGKLLSIDKKRDLVTVQVDICDIV